MANLVGQENAHSEEFFVIGAAARVVGAMRKEVLERRELQKTTKMRVFNAMVMPTLLYGCKTWTIQKRHESKLQAFEMMMMMI